MTIILTQLTQNAGKIWAGLSAVSLLGAASSKFVKGHNDASLFGNRIRWFQTYKILAPLGAMFGALAISSSRNMTGVKRLVATAAVGLATHGVVTKFMSKS